MKMRRSDLKSRDFRTAKKAAPASGDDKKKRKRSRKETYSSYIYKGECRTRLAVLASHADSVVLKC